MATEAGGQPTARGDDAVGRESDRGWLDDPRLRSVRAWLDANLFPTPPAPPALTARRAAACAALFAAGVATQLARMWPSKPLDTIWAEDGVVWLTDSLTRGFLDAVTTPYNGYLQTLSRLVAKPVSWMPVEWFAPAMALAGAAIVTGLAFVVWRASAAHIRNPYLRAALPTLMILLPVVGTETLDNVTNSIWFLLFGCFWVLLWRPATFNRAVAAGGLAFLAAVSNAGAVLLFPVWLLRAVAVRDRRDGVIVGAFVLGLAVQLGLSAGQTDLLGEEPSPQRSINEHWDWNLLPAYTQRVIGGAVTGQTVTGYMWERIGIPLEVVFAAALVAFLAYAGLRGASRIRLLVPLTVAISLATFLVAGYRRWEAGGSSFHWPEGTSNSVASHYMVVPVLLLLGAILVSLDVRPRSLSATAWDAIRTGVVAWMFLAAILTFDVSDETVRGTPTWSDELEVARDRCERERIANVEVAIDPAFPFETKMIVPCGKL